MSETRLSTTVNGRPDAIAFRKVLPVQIVAYVVLVAVSLVVPPREANGAMGVSCMAIPVMLLLVMFALFSSLRDGVPGRVIAAVAGICSLVFAEFQSLGRLLFPQHATGAEGVGSVEPYPQEVWAAGAVGVMVVLVLASFARQMAREDRTHLIRSLSHGVTDGVAMIAVSGWCFLPDLFAGCHAADGGLTSTVAWVSCVVMVVLVLLLGAASYLWARDANPAEDATRPWIGVGLIPVMFLGPAVAVASLIVTLV